MCTGYGIWPLLPRSPSGSHNHPWLQAQTKAAGVGVVEATSAEGMRLQAATSALAEASQVGTSIRASIGNSGDSEAAP